MARDGDNSTVYAFDGFRLDVGKRLLYDPNGAPVALKAKAFETLLFLVQNSGRVVERDELLGAIWPDTAVEENNLTQHISSLRRLFGEKPDEHRFIATVAGRGYQFVAPVTKEKDASADDGRSRSRKWLILSATGVVSLLLVLGFTYFFREEPTPPPNHPIKSIAVLPFKPVSEQYRDESLELGTTQALISKLASAEGITVRPFFAVKKYASSDRNPIEIGHELNVEAVLVGSIQVTPNRDQVRLTVELLNVSDSKTLWTSPFDENLKDIFEVQDLIAERVAKTLAIKLSGYAKKRYTDDVEAYRLYVSGRLTLSSLDPQTVPRAIEYFQSAIDKDPAYALAYTGISEAYRTLILSGEKSPNEIGRLAIEAAEEAAKLDPQLAEAHSSLGVVYFWFERDWERSEASFTRALELDPNSALAHTGYAHLLSNIGRNDKALAEAEKAGALEPFSPYSFFIRGLVYQQAGNSDEAVRQFEDGVRFEPRFWLGRLFAAIAYTDLKRYEDALTSTQKAATINSAQSISMAYECVALARLGRRDEAKNVLDALVARSKEKYVPPYHLAIAYMGLDDSKNALTQLEQGLDERDVKMVFLKADRIWDPLRSEPQFIALMKKMNFPQ